jgi:hypothetical protein
MITKPQFQASLLEETIIIKHLFTKIPATAWDYRPSDKQRSTLELLQYITLIAGAILELLSGKADAFNDFETRKSAVTPENFLETLESEEVKIVELLATFTEEALQKETTNWGKTAPLSVHMLGILKILSAYKMQLFLYIKANGVDTIGTSNLWGGVDMPQQ